MACRLRTPHTAEQGRLTLCGNYATQGYHTPCTCPQDSKEEEEEEEHPILKCTMHGGASNTLECTMHGGASNILECTMHDSKSLGAVWSNTLSVYMAPPRIIPVRRLPKLRKRWQHYYEVWR